MALDESLVRTIIALRSNFQLMEDSIVNFENEIEGSDNPNFQKSLNAMIANADGLHKTLEELEKNNRAEWMAATHPESPFVKEALGNEKGGRQR